MKSNSIYTNLKGHFLTLLSGTVVSQAIPILTLPILARLFTPESFGVFSACMAVSSLLGVLVTLRYDLAIVLAKDDIEASRVFSLVVLLSTLISLGIGLCTYCALPWLSSWEFFSRLRSELVMLLLAPWLIGINQAFTSWSNRHNRYKRMSIAAILQQTSAAGVRFAIGYAVVLVVWNGFFYGSIIGWIVSIAWLAWCVHRSSECPTFTKSPALLIETARKFKSFPIFNTPYSLSGAFSRDFIIYLLTGFGYLSAAGFFGFARTCIATPIKLLSVSLGQVYFQRISNRLGTPEIEELTVGLMSKLRAAFLPGFAALIVWGPDLFEIVFGPSWREAGRYASIYAPATFLSIFSSWPERIFEASGRQRLALKIQLISDVVTVAALTVLLWAKVPLLAIIITYSALSCAYHLIYVRGLFEAAQFSPRHLRALLRQILKEAAVWIGVLITLRLASQGFSKVGIFVSALLVAWHLWRIRRSLLRAPAQT